MVKKAFITGASSGIGKALAFLLSEKKYDLILTGRDQSQLSSISSYLNNHTSVTFFPADLALKEDREKVIHNIEEAVPDLVINAAGFGLYGPATNNISEQLEMIDVNIIALTELTLYTAKALLSQKKKGIIMNISSAAAFFPFPTFAIYAATKSFVNTFSLSLNAELRSHGIHVLTSCPSQVQTQFVKRASKGMLPQNKSFTLTQETAAQYIYQQIKNKKPLCIFDWRFRWGIYLSRLIPKSLLMNLMSKQINSRIK